VDAFNAIPRRPLNCSVYKFSSNGRRNYWWKFINLLAS
jgi:hypothetical protein